MGLNFSRRETQRHGVPTPYLIARLKFCVGAHAEGKLGFADDRVFVLAEVVAEPEDEIRIEGRIDVEVHAEEFEFVLVDFGIRIVVFEAYAQAELLRDVEARFDSEEHLVVCENLFGCRTFVLVDDCIEISESQVENVVVHAWFNEEGMNAVALIRMQSINCIDTVVQDFEALGVIKFTALSDRCSIA